MLLGALTVLLMTADIPLEASIHTLSFGNNGLEFVFILPFTVVGVVVARREPRNPMGWLLEGVGLLTGLGTVTSDYAVFVYHFGHRGSPLGPVAVLLDTGFATGLLLLPLVILLFPDGRLGGRWKWLLRLALVALAVYLATRVSLSAAALGRNTPVWPGGGIVGARNPSGSAAWVAVAQPITLGVFVLMCLASVVRQVLSYRGSSGVRRQQVKWLASGGAGCVGGLLFLASGAANSAPGAVWIVILLGWVALPLSIGVGILKYRLYEIDRLISRTLSYAILTALLVGTFIGLIALSTNTLALSGRVGVAASTLAAAALFNPLRKRIQRLVDRRFNRARYDAEATVAAFTARLRDAVEIDAIRGDLLEAVNRAVEPTHVSVWIKA
ncbi:MAG TPA: hypothetical protein VKS25_03460 [Solirubrobacteraceae bacterium]|nr:hypothetical protein [Solirubrobacteraceae bacterium]